MTQPISQSGSQQIPTQNHTPPDGAPPPRRWPAGWGGRDSAAMAGSIFAGVVMLLLGVLQAVMGVTAMANGSFYVTTQNEVFEFSLTGWGWLHLILGVLVFIAGFGLLAGKLWAMAAAMVLALFSAIDNFLFLPHYPLWSIVVIALDVWVLWALARRITGKAETMMGQP